MFRRLRLFAAALGFAVLAAPAAADPFADCLRSQLRHLGYAPGPASGALDRRTRAAWRKMVAHRRPEFGRELARLPKLNQKTAIHWCRELTALDPGLAMYLPSEQKPVIHAESRAVEQAVLRNLASVRKHFARRHGITLAGNIGIAAAGNPWTVNQYAEWIMRELPAEKMTLGNAINRACSGKAFHAAAFPDWLYICWDTKRAPTAKWLQRNRLWMGPVLAHEYMHLVQAELSGGRASARNARKYLHLMGPAWLVEGAAQVVDARYMETVTGRRRPSLERLRQDISKTPRDLRSLASKQALSSAHAYQTSHFAARLLAERSGERSLFEYWRQIGAGKRPEKAFQASFGIPQKAFEQQFYSLAVNGKAAQAFAEGKGGAPE
ncbi:hypothetical protein RA20_12560 [Leisingera sp. ANG-Vp]|nr:hypothetical protein RA20_12560 [Leisingera sp. ANG-Vp]